MNAVFEIFWDKLRASLKENTNIQNWTVYSGFVGENFMAQIVGEKIYCDPPGAEVTKDDCESIWRVWEKYLAGDVKRKELRDLPHYNTKYVISILHHFMEIIE